MRTEMCLCANIYIYICFLCIHVCLVCKTQCDDIFACSIGPAFPPTFCFKTKRSGFQRFFSHAFHALKIWKVSADGQNFLQRKREALSLRNQFLDFIGNHFFKKYLPRGASWRLLIHKTEPSKNTPLGGCWKRLFDFSTDLCS